MWWTDFLTSAPWGRYEQGDLFCWGVSTLRNEPGMQQSAIDNLAEYLAALQGRHGATYIEEVLELAHWLANETWSGARIAEVLRKYEEQTYLYATRNGWRSSRACILEYHPTLLDTERYFRTKQWITDDPVFGNTVLERFAGAWYLPPSHCNAGGGKALMRRAEYRPELRAALRTHFGLEPSFFRPEPKRMRSDLIEKYGNDLSSLEQELLQKPMVLAYQQPHAGYQLTCSFETPADRRAAFDRVREALRIGSYRTAIVTDELFRTGVIKLSDELVAKLVAAGVVLKQQEPSQPT